jgi:L-alanine-DL-glutamate epimerase-like enolase superfamily enzyme
MKIRKIEPIAVSLPLIKPVKMAGVEIRNADNVIVRVESGDGLVGWGESASAPIMTGETVESMVAAVKHLAPYLEGEFEDIGVAVRTMNKWMYGNSAAKGAIEIALHDLVGRASKQPAYALLGGKRRDRIPTLRMISSGKLDADVAEARASLAAGYVAYKIKVGVGTPEADAERTRRVCETLGRGVLISADANQGYTLDEALRYVEAVGDAGLDFFEQPIVQDDLDGMAKIAASTRIAIGADEGIHSLEHIRRHHQRRAAKGVSLKTIKLGGMRGVMEAGKLCAELGMEVNVACKIAESSIASAAIAHIAAALPSINWSVSITCQYLAADLTQRPLQMAQGHVAVSDAPGLGVEVDEALVRRYQLKV